MRMMMMLIMRGFDDDDDGVVGDVQPQQAVQQDCMANTTGWREHNSSATTTNNHKPRARLIRTITLSLSLLLARRLCLYFSLTDHVHAGSASRACQTLEHSQRQRQNSASNKPHTHLPPPPPPPAPGRIMLPYRHISAPQYDGRARGARYEAAHTLLGW